MKATLTIFACCALIGCASTGPVPMGENLFTISKTSAACGFRDAGGVKADLAKEMTKFCTKKSLYPEIQSLEALDGVIGRRCASATIEFRCVTSSGKSKYAASGEKPNRDMNRSPSLAANQGHFGKNPSSAYKVEQSLVVEKSESKYTQLRDLKWLLDSGVITESEFEREKQEILSN